MNVTEAVEHRLEVRDYADEPVSEETIRATLDAGRLAPSGKNRQHWRFVLVDDDLDRLAELSTTGTWVTEAAFAYPAGQGAGRKRRRPLEKVAFRGQFGQSFE